MSGTRCLVLGGSGFIGSHIVELLLNRGFKVRIFSRSAGFSKRLADGNAIEFFPGDFRDAQSVADAVKGCDYVFHLIATTVPTTSSRDVVFDVCSNLVATLGLLETCVRERVQRVIFSSSGGTVYGRADNCPIQEFQSTEPQCSYGVVKLTIEKYLELFRIRHGLDYTVLRISNCYGPRLPLNGEQGVVGSFLDRLRRAEPVTLLGDGSAIRDYVYVMDVAMAFQAAITHRSPFRIFNIGTGVGTSLLHLIEMMESATNCRFRILRQESRDVDVPVNILDASRARKYLSWEAATSLEWGLVNTWDWIRTEVRATSARVP